VGQKSGSVVDFTQPKRAEEHLQSVAAFPEENPFPKRAAVALRESEAKYRQLFENMPDGFAHCRMLYEDGRPTDFIYLDVNDAFTRLTGLENVVGRRVTEVVPGIRDSSPELFEAYGRVATTGQPERFEIYLNALGIWFSISVYLRRQSAVATARIALPPALRMRLVIALERTSVRSGAGREVLASSSRAGRVCCVG
jgi:PAS domain S-box-containing protein